MYYSILSQIQKLLTGDKRTSFRALLMITWHLNFFFKICAFHDGFLKGNTNDIKTHIFTF